MSDYKSNYSIIEFYIDVTNNASEYSYIAVSISDRNNTSSANFDYGLSANNRSRLTGTLYNIDNYTVILDYVSYSYRGEIEITQMMQWFNVTDNTVKILNNGSGSIRVDRFSVFGLKK